MRTDRKSALFLAVLFAALVAPGLAVAQMTRVAGEPSLVQAERMAAGLRQGMPLEDVRKLLGNPRRTAMRSEGNSVSDATRNTLQWTYTWLGPAGQGTLRVEFGSKVPESWNVTSWEWANY